MYPWWPQPHSILGANLECLSIYHTVQKGCESQPSWLNAVSTCLHICLTTYRYHTIAEYVKHFTGDRQKIQKWTDCDSLLLNVHDCIHNEYQAVADKDNIHPYFHCQTMMSVKDWCILWCYQVVISPPGCKMILEELQTGHLGNSRMKSLAHSYTLWLGMDAE